MTILIIRSEIICMLVLIFLICYKAFYRDKKNENGFLRVALCGLSHVLLDLTTVITVNKIYDIPLGVNRFLHILYYYSGMLFTVEFFSYVVRLTMPHNLWKRMRIISYIPFIVYVVLSFILPMQYITGNGTNYSYGPLVFVGYGIFLVFCITCIALTILRRNHLEFKVRLAIIPTSLLMLIMIIVQAFIPELLMTGAGITIVCIGLFVTINNPVEAFKEEAHWDMSTGVRNKNGFKKHLEIISKKHHKKNTQIGFIIGDMNGLKVINDTYGHAEGDKLIKAAATTLLNNLNTAYGVYRIGGDEFAAIYISPNDEKVKAEIEAVYSACQQYNDSPIPLSIAIGYASGPYSADYMDIYNAADELMYTNKVEIKKNHPELCGR